jgi:hypothetical protein
MPFVERNYPIETLAPCGADETFTMRIRLRRSHWRPQHLERHRPKGLIHGWREDAIAIMDQEAIGAIQRETVPELLDFQSDLGWSVRFQCTIRRAPMSRRTNTYGRLKVALTTITRRNLGLSFPR